MVRNTIQTSKTGKSEKRTYLTSQEVSLLLEQAKTTRYPDRDRALILLTFRHGLRASEAVSMRWDQIHLKTARIDIVRLKGSDDTVQVLESDEVQLLRKLQKVSEDNSFVFVSERGTPMTADNYLKLMKRLGEAAGFTFRIHPHMLRHGTGFAMANAGTSTRVMQQYLGHRNIQHTVRYTKLTNKVFAGLGRVIGGKL